MTNDEGGHRQVQIAGTTPGKEESQVPARLGQILIGRGLITAEEWEAVCVHLPPAGAKETLAALVKQGALTASQARRILRDIEAWAHQQIPGYQLLEKLGQGSMGTVYKARQLSMDRLVAIKILQPQLASNQEYLKRFVQEAHLAAKLSHNNIVQAIDVGNIGSLYYFVMEFVEGTTVKQQLESGKVFSEAEAVEIGLQIAQALDHAHHRGLVHRDIKPANIIVTRKGIAKLADLGLARRLDDREMAESEKGMTIGTPYYIAPELIRGRLELDIRADIYSLGATLYHMVTGRPPFPYNKVNEVLRAHLQEPLKPPDHINPKLSAGLGEVVEACMAKDRDLRYPTPEQLVADLECLLRGEPPRFAHRQANYVLLEQLTHGEAELNGQLKQDTEPEPEASPAVIGLLALLALSVLLNLVLILVLALR